MYQIYKISTIPILFGTAIIIAGFGIFCLFIPKRKGGGIVGLYALLEELNIKKVIPIILCLVSSVVLFFSNSTIVWFLDGQKDLRLAPEGTYCYYVTVSREFSNKEYYLPAKVQKASSYLYNIENVYFSNGGYLYFDIDESDNWYNFEEEYLYDEETSSFNEEMYYMDQNGEFWNITLTNHKSTHPNVYEHYKSLNVNIDMVLSLVGSMFLIIISLIFLITKSPNSDTTPY